MSVIHILHLVRKQVTPVISNLLFLDNNTIGTYLWYCFYKKSTTITIVVLCGANEGNRTPDLCITSALLYLLSHISILGVITPKLFIHHHFYFFSLFSFSLGLVVITQFKHLLQHFFTSFVQYFFCWFLTIKLS